MRNKYVPPSALCWVDDGGQGAAPAGLASQHSLTPALSSPFTRHGPSLHIGKPPPGVQTPLAQPSPSPCYHCALFTFLPLLILLVPLSPRSFQASPVPWVCRLPLLSSQSLDYLHFLLDLFTGSLDCQAWSSCRDFALKKHSIKLCR